MAAELKAVQTDNAALRASLGLKEASDNTKPDSIDRPADCQAIRDIQSIIPADGHFHIYPHGPTNRKGKHRAVFRYRSPPLPFISVW